MCTTAPEVVARLQELANEARDLIESADLAAEDLFDELFGRRWRRRWGSLEEMAREVMRRFLDGIAPGEPDPLDYLIA